MKTKQNYISPEIKLIELDNVISLQLESAVSPMDEPKDWELSSSNSDPLNDLPEW